MEYRTIRYVLIYLEVSVETGGNKVCRPICQQKQNQFKLLEHVLRSHIYSKVIIIYHFFVFIKIHSKWVHPVLTSFAHCMYQVLVQAPVITCLDCFFQFLEEMQDVMFVCRKRIHYHVSVTWIMATQPFILHSHKKTILPLIIISKPLLKMLNLSCLVIFCLLQAISLLYTIVYTIVFRGIFFFLFVLSTKA